MLTVALALCGLVCVVLLVLWRQAEADARTSTAACRDANERSREQALLIRHQCERIDGYRAELDALSIAAPPAAAAALTPDASQDTLSDHWLAYVDSLPTLPTTHEREYPL